ncbi:hypothetical protein [Streptomyces specialis]|uniref:hypothetical protein n=1 Tax=Streptomyces specialis TaxID=498367 RepID=UPI00073E3519|nr:hypothetical protein [Streptomyces specialis]
MSASSDYWPTVGTAAVVYTDAVIHHDDGSTGLGVLNALAARYGPHSLLDLAAVLLLAAAHNCPTDRYRTPDGRPDAAALTDDRPVDALRVLDAAALISPFHQRAVTAQDIAAAERQADAVNRARPLIQPALDAAPRLADIAAALRPAGDSLPVISAVVSLRNATRPPD